MHYSIMLGINTVVMISNGINIVVIIFKIQLRVFSNCT